MYVQPSDQCIIATSSVHDQSRDRSLSLFTFMLWRRKWQPTPVFLPGESRGLRSQVGCRLCGFTAEHIHLLQTSPVPVTLGPHHCSQLPLRCQALSYVGSGYHRGRTRSHGSQYESGLPALILSLTASPAVPPSSSCDSPLPWGP